MAETLRDQFAQGLKEAMKAKEKTAVSTLRLILAALKDRDVAARTKGQLDGINDDEILSMLQSMIKQRQESISLYEQGGRCELAEQERGEVAIIQGFLPKQIEGDELNTIVEGVLTEISAASIKDMGKAMGLLKSRYAGQVDFGKASQLVKQRLAGAA
ncbi:MAG: GatB/YqeY domain-containing protein [Alphaproteobacteria bacterium]|nr:GatB/YqeY domain-containing protein [Alphaproteobacteria bacterium SS10]